MKKLEIYSSFDEMKNNSMTGTVSVTILTERHKKFEDFIQFLRCNDVPKKSNTRNKAPQVK